MEIRVAKEQSYLWGRRIRRNEISRPEQKKKKIITVNRGSYSGARNYTVELKNV